MSSLILKGIKKKYDNGYEAVKDFNLNIKDKEFIVFVGPSGCGKSTTLRMIAGLEEISKGELYIDEILMNNIEPKDRDIAMVFQNYALYPHMTIYDNMAFGLKLRKLPKDEIDNKVRNIAKILGIEDLLKRKPKALSGGQRQRVAMGRAIVRNPKVFLMDEPLSNLDAKLRGEMRIEIAKLHKELDTTFIYVTHDQVEAMTLGTRIVVMKDGEIQQVDSPKNIYENPCNLFVAGFMGSPQMNFIDGKVYKNHLGTFLDFLGKKIKLNFHIKSYEGANEKNVIVGIRPEKIMYCEDIKEQIINFIATVELVENLGAELYVHVKINNSVIVMKLSEMPEIKVGDKINIGINSKGIKVFDKSNEKRIV
ncbi:ABC transporter ATP-binding protein [Clostridium sp.]|uniref:ABC transporter ATP-binding protein n=1 Tax=Clostridium sp. TaxID=1506 RepID=UPI0039927693